jgi:hypothetical protein
VEAGRLIWAGASLVAGCAKISWAYQPDAGKRDISPLCNSPLRSAIPAFPGIYNLNLQEIETISSVSFA